MKSIMINCNPETVSTDYDTSDRLYFEPLTAEDVLEIIDAEQENGTLQGVIVQFGGQTPLKLAQALEAGRRADPRHLARRHRPRRGPRPLQASCSKKLEAAPAAERHRLFRRRSQARSPSRSASRSSSARPMCWAAAPWRSSTTMPSSQRYITEAVVVSGDNPVLFDSYLSDAIEVDVDAHLRRQGRRSSPASWSTSRRPASIPATRACSLPPYSLKPASSPSWKRQTKSLALALKVVGLMNVQFAIKDGEIYVLEVNPRASRTVPFVAKVIGVPVAKIAARIMAGETLASFKLKPEEARRMSA